ncbi:hypothetical protein G6O69_11820 [Pseudenhygromyxa sp. WMMC2535]|uniref:hypothetical protein n=1 Tax=Pseudenhygromyxa sp. WMMC2535 TaxID=2712867 RepID=UPI001556C81C|nr:hypothetical protein [Pseudenhygromyxa sp. WMMC2535]NVB38519.1 hypothetical protein [Pseudenhygromyxa sp. WMMC2535]
MTKRLSRRGALWAVGASSALAATSTALWASPPSREQRRLDNRLELWGTFTRRTHDNLLARYASERSSSLLREALVNGGSLAFIAPATLILRDDGVTGSTTLISPGRVAIEPNDPSLPRRPLATRAEAPALAWLADHLLACFAPGDGQALLADARAEAPRAGGTPKLALMPPRDSAARALIRSVTLSFDQVGGAIVRVEIAESDGGVFVLRLSDHRQDVDTDSLARVTEGVL